MFRRTSILTLLLAASAAAQTAVTSATAQTVADLRRGLANPPDNARIMMRWWWFGPAVSKPELERELRLMKDGGIGGVEIQPVYPLQLDGNLPYLSDAFLDALRFTNDKARELGLRVDLTLCSGWPYGGPHIPITQAAGRLRRATAKLPSAATSVPLPKLAEGEKFLAAFAGTHQLTEIHDNAVQVPPNTAEVQFFIAGRTRQMVKRAAVGAEGYVLDHYNRAAIEHHLHTVGDRLMQAFGDHPPYAVFSDSLEVFASDWTGDFLAEFQKRRGYDLTPYLPALAGDIGPHTAAVRIDWGRTLTELANERYLTPVQQWATAHHTRFRSQTYGTPPVTLSSNALVDLPEGEHPNWREFAQTRQAASASHLYGKPVTSSETWTWLHSPVFRATPLDMKAEADMHFLMGINQLVGHGWPYSPPEAGYPGWRFYAAAVFDQDNPWWIVMPDVTKYLQRASYALRQGKPANDVAVYLPTSDAYAGFTLGRDSVDRAMNDLLGPNVIPQILDAGYNFDFIDDDAIEKLGIHYPVLILPHVEHIPLSVYRKIADYAQRDGVVIGTRRMPSTAPGLKEDERDSPQIKALSQSLFGTNGHMVWHEEQLGKQLRGWIPPDLASDAPLGFVHRALADGDLYFVVNTANRTVRTPARFRAGGATHLDLAPYESRLFLVSKNEVTELPWGGPPGPRRTPASGSSPIDISTNWKLTIPGHPAATVHQLHSWTEDESTRFFSGAATYEKTITVPAAGDYTLSLGEGTPIKQTPRRNGIQAWLDSPVREAAVVYINDQRIGAIWRPPYELPVTLRQGANRIRIVVANLALNAMSSKPLPDYTALIAKYGDRFQPQDMNEVKPQPSGLLGPITLTPLLKQ